MHRQKTTFSNRVTRVATALEKRGIRATYELHDRMLSNRTSRRRFAQEHPELDDVQQQIVSDVDARGYAILPFADLVGAETWSSVEGQGDRFIQETEDALERERRGGDATEPPPPRRQGVPRSSSQLRGRRARPRRSVVRRMRLVAHAGRGERLPQVVAEASYADLWYSLAQPEATERVASQLWHRDFDDKHLLKAFLYLRDVDEGAGPFEYISESQPEAGSTA